MRYSSSDPAVLTVDPATGAITPHAVGVAYVIATAQRADGRTVPARCKAMVTP